LLTYSPRTGILVIRIEESLNFFNAGGIKALFWKIEQKSQYALNGIILDLRNVREIDATAAQTLLDLLCEYRTRQVQVCVVRLPDSAKQMMLKSGIVDLISPAHFFAHTSDALQALETKVPNHSTYL
jgi:MFS superfamily sulfate permease-like transporter